MSPRTGRPLSDNPRRNTVEARMTDDEVKKLDYCCEVTKMTKAEIIRAGIDLVYANLDKFKKT